MIKQQPSIDDVRAAHEGILHLVELGAAFAYPSDDPYDPKLAATCHGTAEQLASAIPLAELRRIFQKYLRRLIASCN